jgi:hypothetical protein
MLNKVKLHVFGDSFTQTFKSHITGGSAWGNKYMDYIGEVPENYTELIANHFDYDLYNHAVGGCSNYTIFDKFFENRKNISQGDIVIFGWTAINRFRIANHQNRYVDILPNTPHPKQNDDVDLRTTQEIAINRDSYSIYWKELEQFVKIINELLKNNIVYHWSWSLPSSTIVDNIWSEDNLSHKNVMMARSWKNIDIDVKNAIGRSCDLLLDLAKPFDMDEIKSLVNSGKRVFGVNIELAPLNILGPFYQTFNCSEYNTINHKKECFKLFIPYYNYETISEETNGNIPDIHYSRNGHKELASTFIELIETKKPIE